MSKLKDLSPLMHDPATNTEKDILFRKAMNDYWDQSIGNNIEKLECFAKFVPRQRLTHFLVKYEIFKKILNVHGSIIEGGVFFGGGLMTWAQLSAILEPINFSRKIIGFDTFSGFPSLSDEDKLSQHSQAKVGGLAVDSYADLTHCIELYDLNRFINHIPKVKLVKGDVAQTIPKFLDENPDLVVSLLYLDFDLFEPTRVALECFVPRMPKGAVIGFDELHSPKFPGETLAVLEELGIRNLRIERFTFEPVISYVVLE